MHRILSLGIIIIILLGVLYACNLSRAPKVESQAQEAAFSGDLPALGLSVQAQNGTYNAVGQTINYQYQVANVGSTVLAGPVAVADNKTVVTCPAVNTVGNLDNNLNPAESVTCVSTYAITQVDLNIGSVTSTTTANAGGVNSNTVTTTVQMTLPKVLELTSSANPTTYNNTGQVINFTYVIKNTGAITLGPAQFVVNDDRLGAINCGAPNSTLATNASISCAGTYTTKDADRAASQLDFNTTTSGGGATSIQTVKVTVTNTAVQGNPPTGYTRGTTIRHQVNPGEWMLQIARCYGADFNAVRNANPQVIDPAKIWPVNVLTVPNIGSNGNIYGPPCVTYYNAQAGDTWNSIAQKFNADLAVLLEANKSVTLAGGVKLKIPLNSANGNPIPVGNEPVRLNFPAGSNKATLSGTISSSKIKDRYILSATQGHTLSVAVNAPAGGLELAVFQNNGIALKPQNATLSWNGTIPANGEYLIEVVNLTTSDRQYALEVVLTTPVTATERVADINAGADSSPVHLAVFNNALYFNAIGADNAGAELWKYDVTSNTASRVADIFVGAEGSNPAFLTEYNGALYFSANGNDSAGIELWRFNGSATGRLSDINTGAGNANPSYMTVFNGFLYFSANSSDGTGTELWRTDGTNISRVADIYTGDGSSNPAYLEVFNNALYFSAASNDGAGTELWKYDGINAPARVSDINPNIGNASPTFLTAYNNVLYFSANGNDNSGTELWKYDGTNAPSRVTDINAGAGDSIPTFLTVFNGELYFSANSNDGAGFELWKFNGTAVSRVSDINKNGDSFPSYLAVYNNQLYFQANGGDNTGRELWRYKGQ